MTSSYDELKQISKAQTRLQITAIVLSIAVAASTVVTWRSASAMREATELERQRLAGQKGEAERKAAVGRRSSSHHAAAGVRGLPQQPSSASSTQSQQATFSGAGTQIANAPAALRQGRQ